MIARATCLFEQLRGIKRRSCCVEPHLYLSATLQASEEGAEPLKPSKIWDPRLAAARGRNRKQEVIQVLSSKVGWRIKRRRLAGIVEILIRDPSSLLQPITSYCIQPCRDTTDPGKLVQALLPLLQLHHISLQPDTSSSQTQPWPAFWVLFCSWSCAWSLLSAPGLLRVRFFFPASQLLHSSLKLLTAGRP